MTLQKQLEERGFSVEYWKAINGTWIQITDLSTAATVYVPDTATLDEALAAINAKNETIKQCK